MDYDPDRAPYGDLLDAFWACHDPTQLNRQGPDYGTQYRTVILCHDDMQRETAEASRQNMIDAGKPVVTQIEPALEYWLAEDYHQIYFAKRGGHRGQGLFSLFR